MGECERCGKKVNLITKYWRYYENGIKKTYCSKCGEAAIKERKLKEQIQIEEEKKRIKIRKKQEVQETINQLKKQGAWDIITNYCKKYKTSPTKNYSWAVGLNKDEVDEMENQDELKEVILDVLGNTDVDNLDAIDAGLSTDFPDFINLKKELSIKYNIKIADDALINVLEYVLSEENIY